MLNKSIHFFIVFSLIGALLILIIDWVVMPLYIRKGKTVRLIDVKNKTLDRAMLELSSEGFKSMVFDTLYTSEIDPQIVIDQYPSSGGKIKKGESPRECLEREVKEELNIVVHIHNRLGVVNHQYSHFKVSITLYECQYKSGQAKALASDEIQWITNNQKNLFAFPSATHKLFQLI